MVLYAVGKHLHLLTATHANASAGVLGRRVAGPRLQGGEEIRLGVLSPAKSSLEVCVEHTLGMPLGLAAQCPKVLPLQHVRPTNGVLRLQTSGGVMVQLCSLAIGSRVDDTTSSARETLPQVAVLSLNYYFPGGCKVLAQKERNNGWEKRSAQRRVLCCRLVDARSGGMC